MDFHKLCDIDSIYHYDILLHIYTVIYGFWIFTVSPSPAFPVVLAFVVNSCVCNPAEIVSWGVDDIVCVCSCPPPVDNTVESLIVSVLFIVPSGVTVCLWFPDSVVGLAPSLSAVVDDSPAIERYLAELRNGEVLGSSTPVVAAPNSHIGLWVWLPASVV